jgi:hypothetical protein
MNPDHRNWTSRVALLASCFLISAFGAGCSSNPRSGYSFASTFPTDVRSVNVPVFENYSFQTGLEADVTEAIIKEIQRGTPMRVVQSESADSKLRGVIRTAEIRRLSLDQTTGLTQELAIDITVDFDWVDLRSGKTLSARRNFSSADTFVPARQTGERIDVGKTGAAQRLAREIVNELRSAW